MMSTIEEEKGNRRSLPNQAGQDGCRFPRRFQFVPRLWELFLVKAIPRKWLKQCKPAIHVLANNCMAFSLFDDMEGSSSIQTLAYLGWMQSAGLSKQFCFRISKLCPWVHILGLRATEDVRTKKDACCMQVLSLNTQAGTHYKQYTMNVDFVF